MIKAIAFDIDNTLSDQLPFVIYHFKDAYFEKYGKVYKGGMDLETYPVDDIFDNYIEDKEWLNEWKGKMWKDMLSKDSDKLLPRKGMVELTQGLAKKGIEVHIISARGSTDENQEELDRIEEASKAWLDKNKIYYDYFHFGLHDKLAQMQASGCEILVEDSPSEALLVSDKFKVFLIDTPYNRLIKGINIWRIGNSEDLKLYNFLEKITYAIDHNEMYTEDADTFLIPAQKEDKFEVLKDGTMLFNRESKKNIIFVIPARQKNSSHENISLQMADGKKNVKIFRLSLLECHGVRETNPLFDDSTVLKVMNDLMSKKSSSYRRKTKDVEILPGDIIKKDTDSTLKYIWGCEVIKELLSIAKKDKKNKYIFDGMETMMLPRDDVNEYKDCMTLITSCTEKDHTIARKKQHKDDWNQFLCLEDLTDASTQIRKWRIIAGTAKKELPNYINRQYADSDGVDCIKLLEGERPYRPDLLDSILSMDTFLIGDLHLSTKDPKKTENIIKHINERISQKDHLLILGDLDGKKGTGSWELCKNTLAKLNTKNLYLILGNNDPYTIEMYVKMGFLSVTDVAYYQPSPQTRIILTHCPAPVKGDEINIHGHIHGSRCYWNVDWKQHYDVWDQDFYPIQIKDCLKILEKDLYKARTEIHRNY